MTLLSRSLTWLKSALATGAGVSITYTRGIGSQTATAWVGRTVFTQQPLQGGGVSVVFGDRDYLIPVSSLTLTDPATPKRGDRITEVVNGVSQTFEVIAPGGEPPWRYADPSQTIYRIHTKRVV